MALRAYISGPMKGYKDYNYPAFNAAEVHVKSLGYLPLNPVKAGGPEYTWQENMRRAIRVLMWADLLVTLPGWQASKGARLEVLIARVLGMPVVFLDLLPKAENLLPEAEHFRLPG